MKHIPVAETLALGMVLRALESLEFELPPLMHVSADDADVQTCHVSCIGPAHMEATGIIEIASTMFGLAPLHVISPSLQTALQG